MMKTRLYDSWCILNKEGMKIYGHIFTDKYVPVLSMIPIAFSHEKLKNPEHGYLLKGSDLTKEQLDQLIEFISNKFKDIDKKKEIETEILANRIPIRCKLTSGSGTRKPYMFY